MLYKFNLSCSWFKTICSHFFSKKFYESWQLFSNNDFAQCGKRHLTCHHLLIVTLVRKKSFHIINSLFSRRSISSHRIFRPFLQRKNYRLDWIMMDWSISSCHTMIQNWYFYAGTTCMTQNYSTFVAIETIDRST